MIIIKTLILYIFLLISFYRVGLCINKWIKSSNLINIIIYGFVGIVAILQIVYIPFILLHVSFDIVLYVTIAIILSLIIISFYICTIKCEKKILKKNVDKIRKINSKNAVITGVLIVCILIQAVVSSLLFNENADDSFYISLMEQNINSDSIYTKDPSLGIENTTVLSNYMISGHELAISVISKIFHIPVTILCHTILIFIMIILSYMAYYILMRKFLKNNKAKVAIILLSVLFLFSGFTTRLRGIILLGRIWQGKEVFLNIVLTLILSNLVNFNKYNRKQNTIKLVLLNFSAVFFTNTAIFLVAFAYLGFAIIEIAKKNWKNILCFILTGVPIMIYAVIYIFIVSTMQVSDSSINLLDIVKDYIGKGYYYILYIISIIIIFIKGNKNAKKYFILVPLIYLITIFNPLLTNIIAKYFTSNSVFWRLLWLMPMEFSIIYSFVILIYLINRKVCQTIIVVIEITSLILLGKFSLTKENGFEKAENLNKIPAPIMEQTQYILEQESENNRQITVMAPPEPLHSVTIRQITSKINLFWSRDMYMKGLYSQEQLDEMLKIYSIYREQGVPSISNQEFNSIRDKYGINWIIVDSYNTEVNKYIEQIGYNNKNEIKGYYLYQY